MRRVCFDIFALLTSYRFFPFSLLFFSNGHFSSISLLLVSFTGLRARSLFVFSFVNADYVRGMTD